MQQMQQVEPAVGMRYRVIRPSESFEDTDGSLVSFAPVEFVAEILEKPEKVIAFDGFKETVEPLPEHLKAPEWLLIRKLRNGRTQWLHRRTCQLVPLP